MYTSCNIFFAVRLKFTYFSQFHICFFVQNTIFKKIYSSYTQFIHAQFVIFTVFCDKRLAKSTVYPV